VVLALGVQLQFRHPFNVFRLTLSVWAIIVFLAHRLVQDQFGTGPHGLLLVTLAVLWMTPRSWWSRLVAPLRPALAAVALVFVSTYSLWGRVPDFEYPLGELFWLYSTTAVLVFALTLAAFRWPRTAGVIVAAIGLSAVLATNLPRTPPSERPNVLWILVDTARRDHIRPFGNLVQTPAIESLADEGVVFDDAVTVIPKTSQSIASFFTGLYPIHHGLRTLSGDLAQSIPNVVKRFKESGYRTAAFVNNPWLSTKHGFGQGFEQFYNNQQMAERDGGALRYVSWSIVLQRLMGRSTESTPVIEGYYQAKASRVTDSATRYLRGTGRESFFLYVHYFEPHWPYLPPRRLEQRYDAPPGETNLVNFIEKTGFTREQVIFDNPLPEEANEGARRLYRGEMDDTMSEVGRLIKELDRVGLRDDTIVVFTADHGHALGEHRYYFHHGAFLYEDSVQIPLILSLAERLPPARREHQVRSIDVAPTLLELAGLKVESTMDGRSLSRYWEGGENQSRDVLIESDVKMMDGNRRRRYHGIPGKLRALRTGRFKLILSPDVGGPAFELYDLTDDPGETHNLAHDDDHKEIFTALLKELSALIPAEEMQAIAEVQRNTEPDESLKPIVDQRDLELLRRLGYVK